MRYGLVALVVLVSACSSAKGENKAGTPEAAGEKKDSHAGVRRRVEVATVADSSARIELRLPGEIEGARDALLAASMGGFVESVNVENGDAVKKGALLLSVDASTHQTRLEQAQVELRAAERELKRAKAVGDAIAESNLDAAETRHAAAKAAVATARVGVARAAIRAPFAGTVASVAVEQGEVAPPGSPVVRLVQLDPIKVKVNVSDREVVALKEGMDAHVSTGAQSKDFMGKITHINPAADLRTRSFEVDVEVPNPDHLLRPGMIATVRVSEEVVSSDLIIPQDWVVTRLDGIGVFVEKDGVARWQPIVLGDVVREQVVVKEGIAPDTRVIYKGHRELVDGDRVLVARSGVCCTEGRIQYP